MNAIASLGVMAPIVAFIARDRARARAAPWSLDAVLVATTLGLAASALLGVALAVAGFFAPVPIACGGLSLGLVIWSWRSAVSATAAGQTSRSTLRDPWLWLGLAAVLGGIGLRAVPMRADLAGRDQGTYVLRAMHTARTGGLEHDAPLLERANAERELAPGPDDLLGLFPRTTEPHRVDRYEGPYRPGFYLADRESGRVVPQFFHLHPTLLALGALIFGPAQAHMMMLPIGALGLLLWWAVARRLWPSGPWSALAGTLLALQPLAIWTARTPLTESLTFTLGAAALLCVLRAREGEPQQLTAAAFLIGCTAFVRGNAWITAPVVGALLLLRPRTSEERCEADRALVVWAGTLLASAVVHGPTTHPYIHDEIARLVGPDRALTWLSPWTLPTAAGLGLGVLLALDRRSRRRPEGRLRAELRARAPLVLSLGALMAAALYLWLAEHGPARPFSRLDPAWPLLGPPLLIVGLGGLVVFGRWRPGGAAADVWLLALASLPTVTALLYARRNLPQLGLYYYGRYLVPELLPALVLLAVAAIRALALLLEARPWPYRILPTAPALALIAWPGAALLLYPVTRLDEFRDTRRGLEHLHGHIQPGAVVIAGGEGWHRGHAENQLGGALELGFDHTVLPYRDRERAYATLFELLVDGPSRRGAPPPPVVLLLNEVSKPFTDAQRRLVAGIDDGLPPPFRLTRADLLTLYLHRLTPVTDQIPARLALSSLRVGLLRVEVDPAALSAIERWYLDADGSWTRDRALAVPRCLDPAAPLQLELPGGAEAHRQIALVAAPGTALYNETWAVGFDGAPPVELIPPGVGPRERDTLGPFLLAQRPRRVELRGAERPLPEAPCPHGGLFELRMFGLDTHPIGDGELTVEATVIGPADDRGFPQPAPVWTSGSALNRHRPGTTPPPEVEGAALRLRGDGALHFARTPTPAPEVELVITLTGTQVGPDARLELAIDGEMVARFDPPDAREGAWQTPRTRLGPVPPDVQVTLRLAGAGPDDVILVRDVALFATH